jgi:outer membrane protein
MSEMGDLHRIGGGRRGAGTRPGRFRRAAIGLAAAGAALTTLGCVHRMSEVRTSPGSSRSPDLPWTPPADLAPTPIPSPAPTSVPPPGLPAGAEAAAGPSIPADLLKAAENWSLPDLVDLALRNSPQTRIAWAQARSAAADLGSKKGAYYPTIVGDVTSTKTKGSAVGGLFTFETATYNPFLALNWVLFDFGGRKATVEEARQALIAADWSHNAAIQDVVLEVEQAYYQYLNARVLAEAEQAAVKEAEASLDAAEHRRAAGLSTIADVLQAKTGLSQARLILQTVEGQIETIHGSLATAMGLPANTRFDVAIPPFDLPAEQASVEVERAIQEAEARRPDLASARAAVLKAEAEVRVKAAQDRPTIAAGANGGRIFYNPFVIHQDTYSASLLVTIPIFNGMTYQYNLFRARADRDEAQARLETLHQSVVLQVWSSYYNHRTAGQRVETSRDLLSSARQSYEVVSARYQAGVGSILDLLTAQSQLESARAQEAQARTDWLMTLAQLAHDTGTLWQPAAAGRDGQRQEGGP